jgi:uncharacterized membrane protein
MKVTLFSIVLLAFCATSYLRNVYTRHFYTWCMIFQAATLVGILTNSFYLIQAGHVGFAIRLYLGAFHLPHPEMLLVYSLCSVALLTRQMFRGCLFDLITDRNYTQSYVYDVLFLLPIIIGISLQT